MPTPVLPLHVIHVPSATHRWRRWPALVQQGLAIEEPAVTPDEFDIKEMVKTGRLGLLAAWRIAANLVPVDRCVLTAGTQVACALSHLRLFAKQAESGDPVWVTCEDDANPSLEMIRGIPKLIEEMDKLDPEWDMVSMASWYVHDHKDPPKPVIVDVPGVGRVRIARIRYMEGAGAQLVSLRGAKKLVPIMSHMDTHVDKVTALASDLNIFRLYNATREGFAGIREPYMPLGVESASSTLGHNLRGDGAGATPTDLPVLWPLAGACTGLVIGLGVVCLVAVVLLVLFCVTAVKLHRTRSKQTAVGRYVQ